MLVPVGCQSDMLLRRDPPFLLIALWVRRALVDREGNLSGVREGLDIAHSHLMGTRKIHQDLAVAPGARWVWSDSH